MKSIWANDLFLKLISLLLAIALWLYIIVAQNPETEAVYKDIPVTVVESNILHLDDVGQW